MTSDQRAELAALVNSAEVSASVATNAREMSGFTRARVA